MSTRRKCSYVLISALKPALVTITATIRTENV